MGTSKQHPDVDTQPKSSQNMSSDLLKSLLPLNVWAHLCEWGGKSKKNASTGKSNLTLQWQQGG